MFNNNCEQARNIVADALESGRYTQGTGCLEKDGRNCCLGVAIREFMLHEDHEIETSNPVGQTRFGDSDEGWRLLPVVQDWLGFNSEIGMYDDGYLVADNDNGKSFSEIAKLFRNPPKGLIDV